MNTTTPLTLEAQLSLYNDTTSHVTGQYFCNIKPFAMPRSGNTVSLLSCGKEALQQIHDAMLAAESFIWIADWQMAFDVELANRGGKDNPGRLHNVIHYIIKTKKVHVRVLLYKSIIQSKPGTYDEMVAERLNALNSKDYPGSVNVIRQPSTSDQIDAHDYSHHQKFVVVDGHIGFIGGIDLSYGRWETPEFDVVVDPERYVINDMYNPGQTKMRSTTTIEKGKIKQYSFVAPYGDHLIDEGCQPRMPWQDVHIKIEGPSVVDIHRNFVRRWNSRLDQMGRQPFIAKTLAPLEYPSFKHPEPSPLLITKQWLEKIGGWAKLTAVQPRKGGGAQVQIVRSVSILHLRGEGVKPEDLLLHKDQRERELWELCLTSWGCSHQSNILTAMVNCIKSAVNYIYIETQFFISQFGMAGKVDSEKIGSENDGIKNMIVDELAKCIDRHICALVPSPFHVYIVIPTHPEGLLSDDSIWKQQWMAMVTIKHGSNSLINRIKRSLAGKNRDPEEWVQYLTVLNMRNYGATVLYARDPVTFDEDFNCEIGRYVVTEQIYIHSKLMIVDDAVAIIGTANTNDRSLTGNGDTEISAVIVDIEGVELRDLGSPKFKVQTRRFARELRQQLWKKHFGFLVESTDSDHTKYFASTTRALRGMASIPAAIPHPPRVTMEPGLISSIGKADWGDIYDKPCAPATVKAIQTIAKHNTKIYEEVFEHTPRDSMTTFNDLMKLKFHSLPYPPSFKKHGDELVAQAALVKNMREAGSPLYRTEEANMDPLTLAAFRQHAAAKRPLGDRDGNYKHFRGVLPPALNKRFMTESLLPHQLTSLKEMHYARRQQVFADGAVHDVASAIAHLKKNIVGFFTAAPLDWGMDQEIKGNPGKASIVRVGIF